jgi:hypothetical protein
MLKYKPYSQHAQSYMMPGNGAKFLRNNFLWQGLKFLYYNYKIIKLIVKPH